jgi:hypothetical protein
MAASRRVAVFRVLFLNPVLTFCASETLLFSIVCHFHQFVFLRPSSGSASGVSVDAMHFRRSHSHLDLGFRAWKTEYLTAANRSDQFAFLRP